MGDTPGNSKGLAARAPLGSIDVNQRAVRVTLEPATRVVGGGGAAVSYAQYTGLHVRAYVQLPSLVPVRTSSTYCSLYTYKLVQLVRARTCTSFVLPYRSSCKRAPAEQQQQQQQQQRASSSSSSSSSSGGSSSSLTCVVAATPRHEPKGPASNRIAPQQTAHRDRWPPPPPPAPPLPPPPPAPPPPHGRASSPPRSTAC